MAKKMVFDDIESFGTNEIKTTQTIELGKIVKIPIDLIDIGENIRNIMEDDESKLIELGQSIKENGLIEPCIVYQEGDRYILNAGSRRYKASVLAELPTLDCIISKKFSDEKERIIYQAIENEHRENMNSRERETYMARLLELGMNQSEIARALHKGKGWVSEALTAHSFVEENKDIMENLPEDTSTRDAYSLSKLSKSELKELVDKTKENGGDKKTFKSELNKKLSEKKETPKEQNDNPEQNDKELNEQINKDFDIEFEVEENIDETPFSEETENEVSDEYTLGLHLTFKVNDKNKTLKFTGEIDDLETEFHKQMLRHAKNYYIGLGYNVE